MDNELRTYLKENIVNHKKDFSVLGWWRVNTISVAFDFAFTTCGRVVSQYRTSLLTLIVEVLLCTQDWVRKSTNLIIDNVDDILIDHDISLGKKFILVLFL
uniref:HAT C-terminal dimerisation domain-containing protein n=1 Tax=Lactuca sativa TaxID=4236 RepID=A0A9R1UKH1_LACSA|nr:hypothetical protein LSAT_V11C900497280 [Lactuca sativa]